MQNNAPTYSPALTVRRSVALLYTQSASKGAVKESEGRRERRMKFAISFHFFTFLDVIQKEVNNTRKEQMEIAVNVYGQHPNEWWNNWSVLQWVLNYQNGTLCQSAICIFSEYLKIETIAFRQIRRHSVTPHLPVFGKTTKRRDDQTILNYRRTEKEDADHNEKKAQKKAREFSWITLRIHFPIENPTLHFPHGIHKQ